MPVGLLNSTLAVVLVAIGLLSGALAVFREVQVMYFPAKANEKKVFWAFVRIAFVISLGMLLYAEHDKVLQLSAVVDAGGFMQLENREILSESANITVGAKLMMNYHIFNRGTRPVTKTQSWGTLVPMQLSANGPNPDRRVKNVYQEACKKAYEVTFKDQGSDVGVNQETWGTAVSEPLTEQQVTGLIDGDYRLYLVVNAFWKSEADHEGAWSSCSWAEGIDKNHTSLVGRAWRNCG